MAWLQVSLHCENTLSDQISDLLSESGAQAITLKGLQSHVYEPAPGETRLWPDTELNALFDLDTDPSAIFSALAPVSKQFPMESLRVERIEDQDWERVCLDGLQPARFGQRLWICPGDEPVDQPDAVIVRIDPGLAFGTGTHPTTGMCLQWLDSLDLQDMEVIDYGCGSGILAIAAALLGARRVHAIDIDEQALLATRDNAERNQVADRIQIYTPETFKPLQADLLVANILANPLIELAPEFCNMLKPGGQLGVSGILEPDADRTREAFAKILQPVDTRTEAGWAQISFIKPAEQA